MNVSMILLVASVIVGVTTAGTGSSTTAPPVPCPAVTGSPAVRATYCHQNNKQVDCSMPMTAGTVAVTVCSPGFTTSTNNSIKSSTCLTNGTWDNEEEVCKRDCGQQLDVTNVTIHGEELKDGLLPWNIRIYHKTWGQMCQGTLITPSHVVTSVYRCVSDHSAADLQLAARKLIYHFSPTEPNAQLRGVRQVIKHEQYDSDNYNNDIAVLVADCDFVLSTKVAVVCIDWTGLMAPTSTSTFIGDAWVRGKMDTSRALTAAQSFTLVDDVTCRAQSWSSERKYLTADKICARPSNNETCGDPYGGGLVMTSAGDRHYLWGMKSVLLAATSSGSCKTGRVNGYTSISHHLVWLMQHTTT